MGVDNGQFGRTKRSGFSVTSWTLRRLELEWEKDCVLQVDDLWCLEKFRDSPLPRWVPEFPVVSKQNSDLLHFVLRGPHSSAKAWMISISMRQKLMKSYMPYTNDYTNLPKEDEDLDLSSFFSIFPLSVPISTRSWNAETLAVWTHLSLNLHLYCCSGFLVRCRTCWKNLKDKCNTLAEIFAIVVVD